MRTQRTAKGNREAGRSCSCDRGLHRYLRNFGGEGVEHPKPHPRYATGRSESLYLFMSRAIKQTTGFIEFTKLYAILFRQI